MTATDDIVALRDSGSASDAVRIGEPDRPVPPDIDAVPAPLASNVARLVRLLFLAGTTGTAAMTAGTLSFPSMDFRPPGSVAHIWAHRRRRRRPISVSEAHAIALHAMEETERLLREERMAEAAFLAQLFEDEEFVSG